jgi:hypothetical protein
LQFQPVISVLARKTNIAGASFSSGALCLVAANELGKQSSPVSVRCGAAIAAILFAFRGAILLQATLAKQTGVKKPPITGKSDCTTRFFGLSSSQWSIYSMLDAIQL